MIGKNHVGTAALGKNHVDSRPGKNHVGTAALGKNHVGTAALGRPVERSSTDGPTAHWSVPSRLPVIAALPR